MKNLYVIELTKLGFQDISNSSVDIKDAYQVVKLRGALKTALERIMACEETLLADAGITDAQAFDARMAELTAIKEPDEKQKAEMEKMASQRDKYVEMRQNLLDEEAQEIDIRPLAYESWFALLKSNGIQIPVQIEDAMKGVLWVEPE